MKKFLVFLVVFAVLVNVIFIGYLLKCNISYKRQIELIFSNEEVVKVSEEPLQYICKSDDAPKYFEQFMLSNGWELSQEDQLGSECFFKKDGKVMAFDLSYRGSIAVWSLD